MVKTIGDKKMETKSEVIKKEAGTKVTGTGSFDKSGNLLVPVLNGTKVEMTSTEGLKQLLDKKEAKLQKAKSPKVAKEPKAKKQKVVIDETIRSAFADRAVKQIDGLTINEVGDKIFLKFGSHTVARLMLRAGHNFTAYRRGLNNERLTLRVPDEAAQKELMDWCKARVEHLKLKAPKPKVKTPRKVSNKTVDKNHGHKVTLTERLNKLEATAKTHADATGFGLGRIQVSNEVKGWAKSKGYSVNCKSIKF